MTIDKVADLDDAVGRLVRPGDTIHLAYGGGRPNAAVAGIMRRFGGSRPGFTVSACGFVSTQHAMVAAGLVSKLVVAFAGDNYPVPRPNRILRRALRDGSVAIENWSIWTLTARLIAGALGTPFFPVHSLASSGLAGGLPPDAYRTLEIADGMAGGMVGGMAGGPTGGMVGAFRPDVVLLSGLAADRAGNVLLVPPYGEGAWGAFAGRTTIACVERLVDDEVVRAHSSLPLVPSYAVDAVCVTPFGSHPYGMDAGPLAGVVEGYGEDEEFMAEFTEATKTDEAVAEWIARWVLRPRSHEAFLEQLGASRLRALREDADRPPRGPGATGPPSPAERMTLAATRVVRDRVRATGAKVVLSGIGYAHLAAWTAVPELVAEGRDVSLAAELGMVGFQPRPGDPYLFARRNFPTSRQLTDVMAVLGRDVGGSRLPAVGVLGAGQVDQHGNVNSTWADDGSFIVGSGGANDVANGAVETVVVVPHARDRLVARTPYVTAPGGRVTAVVTTEAVLERRDDRLVATTYLGEGDGDAARRRLAELTGWTLAVADDLRPEPPPSQADLRRLRSFDPRGVFFRR